MGTKRLYLDTSVISAFFDQRAPERKRMTEEFWQSLNIHRVFISTLVLEELDAAQDDLRTKMREKVKDSLVLEVTQAADELAERYIDEGIIPESYRDDAVHVAVATTNHIEFLVSWNFKHLNGLDPEDAALDQSLFFNVSIRDMRRSSLFSISSTSRSRTSNSSALERGGLWSSPSRDPGVSYLSR